MRATTSEPNSFFRKGGGWAIGQSLLLTGVLAAGPLARGTGPAWIFAGGCLLFVLAGAIGIAGVLHLDRNRTPFPAPRPNSQLVTKGIYGWIRHPLYTCLVLAALGWAGIFFSKAALASSLPLAIFLFAKSRVEERFLMGAFPDYAAYRKRVCGFIPGIV